MDIAIISAKREDGYCAFRIPMAFAEAPVFLRRGRRSGKRFSTLGRRHYDPTVGRFLEPDSAQWLDPKRFGGINPYAYCLNDPIEKEDPSGRFVGALLLGAGVGFVLGFGFNLGKQVVDAKGDWRQVNWGTVFGHAILGAAFGAAGILGGAAGMASLGYSIVGYSLSFEASLGIAAGMTAFAGMADYSLSAIKTGKWSLAEMFRAGVKSGYQGLATFGFAYLGGKSGLFLYKFGDPGNVLASLPKGYDLINIQRAFREPFVRAALVSLPSFLSRWLIDWLLPEEDEL